MNNRREWIERCNMSPRKIEKYKRYPTTAPFLDIDFWISQIFDITLWQAMSKIEKQAETNRRNHFVFPTQRERERERERERVFSSLFISWFRCYGITLQSKHFDNMNSSSIVFWWPRDFVFNAVVAMIK